MARPCLQELQDRPWGPGFREFFLVYPIFLCVASKVLNVSGPHRGSLPRSRVVTDGGEATTSRGMLCAVGMGDEDWVKPQIGIASSWNGITPCNLSLGRLAQAAKEVVHSGGGCPLQFGTVSVSGGISMGHEGMHFSLVSREVIADLVEAAQ